LRERLTTRIYRLLFDGARHIDVTILVVDLLVLVVIVIEWIRTESRERKQAQKASQREKLVAERIEALRQLMSQGQEIQSNPPPPGDARVDSWSKMADRWGEKTQALLRSYSAPAETSFLHRPPIGPTTYAHIGAQVAYSTLVARLDNLRGIIEKPDVYL
jgi:type II secretory pathway pseudopilin PulG